MIEAVVRRSGWADWSPAGSFRSAGRGIGYARYKNSSAYCAVVAEVEAVTEVRVRRLTIAVDAGLVINPDGAENQVEGGAIQATSWTLKERVRFDRFTVTSDTWDSYPILRFSEVPAVEVELLPGHEIRRWASEKPRKAPPPRPLATPSATPSVSACAGCRSPSSRSSPRCRTD